jgi:K+-sensing histidine kinase KdpD
MRDRSRNQDLFDLVPLGSVVAYVLAMLLVIAATVLRWGFGLFDDEVASLATFYLAVAFSTLIGGWGPGAFATLLGGVIVWWVFLPPQFSFDLSTGNAINLLMYLVGCALMVWGIEHYRLFKRAET